jgi:hypothetical protein
MEKFLRTVDNQRQNLAFDHQRNYGNRPTFNRNKAVSTDMCPVCRANHRLWKLRKFLAIR